MVSERIEQQITEIVHHLCGKQLAKKRLDLCKQVCKQVHLVIIGYWLYSVRFRSYFYSSYALRVVRNLNPPRTCPFIHSNLAG